MDELDLELDVVPDDRALYLDVVLTKGANTRTWHIGRSIRPHEASFRRSEPGLVSLGALPTLDAVEAKRREFETDVASARADGWIWRAEVTSCFRPLGGALLVGACQAPWPGQTDEVP